MKTKDLMLLILAVLILLVSGYVGYTQLTGKKSGAAKVVQVEVIGTIPSQLDQSGMSYLDNSSKVSDYTTPISLSGLNNAEPFGP